MCHLQPSSASHLILPGMPLRSASSFAIATTTRVRFSQQCVLSKLVLNAIQSLANLCSGVQGRAVAINLPALTLLMSKLITDKIISLVIYSGTM